MKILALASFEPFPLKQTQLPQYFQGQNSITKPFHDFWHEKGGY